MEMDCRMEECPVRRMAGNPLRRRGSNMLAASFLRLSGEPADVRKNAGISRLCSPEQIHAVQGGNLVHGGMYPVNSGGNLN